MDDNILLALFIFGFIGAVALIIRAVNKATAKRKSEYEAEMTRQREETRKWRERMYEKSKMAAIENAKAVPPKAAPTVTYSARSDTRTMNESSDNSFVNGMLTQMLIDTTIDAFKHGTDRDTGVTYDREVERSVGVSSSTREIGYDSSDEPSRSSSWSSSSSSSDSWSSSSDSSPSSDW